MIAPLRERLASMTFREKIDYLWEYYKIHFFIIIGLIAAIIYGITSFTGNKEPVLNVVFVGETLDLTVIEEVEQEWTEILLDEEAREETEITLQYVNITGTGSGPQDVNELQKFTTLLAAGAYDVIISHEEIFGLLQAQGAMTNLSNIVNLDTIDTEEHEIMYSEANEPIAIRAREMEAISPIFPVEDKFLYVPKGTTNTEYIDSLVQYLAGE